MPAYDPFKPNVNKYHQIRRSMTNLPEMASKGTGKVQRTKNANVIAGGFFGHNPVTNPMASNQQNPYIQQIVRRQLGQRGSQSKLASIAGANI